MSLTKEAILAVGDDRPIKEVAVPEWGGIVHVRPLSALELHHTRAAYEEKHARVKLPMLAMAALCDPDGNRIFDFGNLDALLVDAETLNIRSGAVLYRICNAASIFSEESTEEAEKNSEAIRADNSSSS